MMEAQASREHVECNIRRGLSQAAYLPSSDAVGQERIPKRSARAYDITHSKPLRYVPTGTVCMGDDEKSRLLDAYVDAAAGLADLVRELALIAKEPLSGLSPSLRTHLSDLQQQVHEARGHARECHAALQRYIVAHGVGSGRAPHR